MRRTPASLLLSALLTACPGSDFDRAKALEAEGKLEPALELYRTIAEREPGHVPAWDKSIELACRRLADLAHCTNLLELELKVLGNIDRHRDALSEVLEARARTRLESGLAREALDDLARAERASPWRASVWVVKAKAHVALGEREEAERAIARARQLDPTSAEADGVIPELPEGADDPAGFGGP